MYITSNQLSYIARFQAGSFERVASFVYSAHTLRLRVALTPFVLFVYLFSWHRESIRRFEIISVFLCLLDEI